jgi:aromatic-amino-acid transaminase
MSGMSMFEHVPAYAGDPILTLNENFQKDPRPGKVNLSIGVYFDESGKLPVLKAVRAAEQSILENLGPHPYLPMAGSADYRKATQALVFGASCRALSEGRVATLQTIGGSGALKVAADFLHRYLPEAQIWISDPSWENHRAVFEGSGLAVNTYPYYDVASGGLRFEAMLAAVRAMPSGSILLLHACCHNPTGVDLSREQWQALVPVLLERNLIALIDIAYQGFGDGLEEDAFGIRTMTDAGVTCVVVNSYSKNFSLYGERCGGLSVVCASVPEAEHVLGQLMRTIRANYSNPPTYGARIIATVLGDPTLRAQWQQELGTMRERIKLMRQAIHDGLQGSVEGAARSRYLTQRGMFSYTGLTAEQVDRLREQHAVYLLRSGRMCVAGLNTRNVSVVAAAFASVLGTHG